MKKTLQPDIRLADARVTGNTDARAPITQQPRRPTTIARRRAALRQSA